MLNTMPRVRNFVRITGIFIPVLVVPSLVGPASAQQTKIEHYSHYRGFSFDDSVFLDDPNIETIRKNVHKEIDVLFVVGLSEKTLTAFRTEPIKLVPDGPRGHYQGKRIEINAVLTNLKEQESDDLAGSRNLLHEFMHFYQHKLCSDEDRKTIAQFYDYAKANKLFKESSYLMRNAGEFWAVAGCTFLYGTASRPPWSRENIKTKMPKFFEFMQHTFGGQAGTYNPKLDTKIGGEQKNDHR